MAQPSTPVYRERLWPSFAVWFLAVFVLAMVDIAVWAGLGLTTGLAVTMLSAAGVGYWLLSLSIVIEVVDERLRAGRAHIALSLLSDINALDTAATRSALGPSADGRTYLVTRPWIRTAVTFAINDNADPTPGWLVSTRHPSELAAALTGIAKVT